jgi:hypothetical protein
MNVQFLTLFTLRAVHGFYDGPCRDFGFLVPAETAALLRNGKLLARELDGTLHVLFEASADGDPLRPLPGATLRMGMQLLNPYFGNFTVLPAGFPARRLRYTNAADPGELAPADDFAFVPDTFAHALADDARPATVTLRDGAGTVVREDALGEDDETAALSYDLRGAPTGPLEVEEEYPGPVTETTALYLDPELRGRDAAVVVEVTVHPDFYADAPAFTVPFDARQEVLSYYVVAGGYLPGDLATLTVTDEGAALDGRPPVTFVKTDGEDLVEPDLTASLLAPGGEPVVLFRSAAELPRRERGRRRIQLSKNGDVLMANLPQPGVERAQADLILHLSKP